MPLANGLRNGTFCCPHIQVGEKYHGWLINAMSLQPSGLYKSSIRESVQPEVKQCLSEPLPSILRGKSAPLESQQMSYVRL